MLHYSLPKIILHLQQRRWCKYHLQSNSWGLWFKWIPNLPFGKSKLQRTIKGIISQESNNPWLVLGNSRRRSTYGTISFVLLQSAWRRPHLPLAPSKSWCDSIWLRIHSRRQHRLLEFIIPSLSRPIFIFNFIYFPRTRHWHMTKLDAACSSTSTQAKTVKKEESTWDKSMELSYESKSKPRAYL